MASEEKENETLQLNDLFLCTIPCPLDKRNRLHCMMTERELLRHEMEEGDFIEIFLNSHSLLHFRCGGMLIDFKNEKTGEPYRKRTLINEEESYRYPSSILSEYKSVH
jgi:hypothetical protein